MPEYAFGHAIASPNAQSGTSGCVPDCAFRPVVHRAAVEPRRSGESIGSAVVGTTDGFLLTNARRRARDRRDGRVRRRYDRGVPLAGTDPLSDLAVLRASGARRRQRNSARRRPGRRPGGRRGRQPPGLAGSVTSGVMNALGRSLPARRQRPEIAASDRALSTSPRASVKSRGKLSCDGWFTRFREARAADSTCNCRSMPCLLQECKSLSTARRQIGRVIHRRRASLPRREAARHRGTARRRASPEDAV